jgi:hypothetical protein
MREHPFPLSPANLIEFLRAAKKKHPSGRQPLAAGFSFAVFFLAASCRIPLKLLAAARVRARLQRPRKYSALCQGTTTVVP